MPVGARPMLLQPRDDAEDQLALPRQRANGGGDGAGGDAGDLAEETTAIEAVRAQPLRDRKHHLPVWHGREQRRVEPLGQYLEALGVTARAEVAALAREGQQILVRANVAADAREPVVENAAGEELVSDLCDDGAP